MRQISRVCVTIFLQDRKKFFMRLGRSTDQLRTREHADKHSRSFLLRIYTPILTMTGHHSQDPELMPSIVHYLGNFIEHAHQQNGHTGTRRCFRLAQSRFGTSFGVYIFLHAKRVRPIAAMKPEEKCTR